MALALALLAHAGLAEPNRHDLARTCSRVENDWVGARTGLLDQLAALYGREGHALRLDMRSLEVEPVPLELGDWRLVTIDSGVEHAHAGSGDNERREEAARAAQALGVDSLRDAEAAGAAGARIMGGGFGGSVLALFPPGSDPAEDAGAVEVTPGPAARLLVARG